MSIYQTPAMAATISWLSLAPLDCYLHGQEFLILQRDTLALLADQQSMGGLAAGATVSALVDGRSPSLGRYAPLEHGWHLRR